MNKQIKAYGKAKRKITRLQQAIEAHNHPSEKSKREKLIAKKAEQEGIATAIEICLKNPPNQNNTTDYSTTNNTSFSFTPTVSYTKKHTTNQANKKGTLSQKSRKK